MGRVPTSTIIEEGVKEMAMSKGINLSRTLEDSLKAELDIAEIPKDEKDEIIHKLKLKLRKTYQIMRDLRTEIAQKQAKIVQFEAKKHPKVTSKDIPLITSKELEEIRKPEFTRDDIERKKRVYLEKNKAKIADLKTRGLACK